MRTPHMEKVAIAYHAACLSPGHFLTLKDIELKQSIKAYYNTLKTCHPIKCLVAIIIRLKEPCHCFAL